MRVERQDVSYMCRRITNYDQPPQVSSKVYHGTPRWGEEKIAFDLNTTCDCTAILVSKKEFNEQKEINICSKELNIS